MNAQALFLDLSARGVVLEIADEKLIFDAPRGVLTENDLAQLRKLKPELLELLSTPTAPDAPAVAPADAQSTLHLAESTPSTHLVAWPAHRDTSNDAPREPLRLACSDPVAERIRSMAAQVTPELVIQARRRITPTMRKEMTDQQIHLVILGEALRLKRAAEYEAEKASNGNDDKNNSSEVNA
jgi:hypothetical protein